MNDDCILRTESYVTPTTWMKESEDGCWNRKYQPWFQKHSNDAENNKSTEIMIICSFFAIERCNNHQYHFIHTRRWNTHERFGYEGGVTLA